MNFTIHLPSNYRVQLVSHDNKNGTTTWFVSTIAEKELRKQKKVKS